MTCSPGSGSARPTTASSRPTPLRMVAGSSAISCSSPPRALIAATSRLLGRDGPQAQDRAAVLGDVAHGVHIGHAGSHMVIDEHADERSGQPEAADRRYRAGAAHGKDEPVVAQHVAGPQPHLPRGDVDSGRDRVEPGGDPVLVVPGLGQQVQALQPVAGNAEPGRRRGGRQSPSRQYGCPLPDTSGPYRGSPALATATPGGAFRLQPGPTAGLSPPRAASAASQASAMPCACRWVAAWPRIAVRNGSLASLYTVASLWAVTVAVRGLARSRAISPAPSPRPHRRTKRPSWKTSNCPAAIA